MSGRIGVSEIGQIGKEKQLGILSTASPDNAFASREARGLALTTAPSTIAKRGAKTLEETISNQSM
jgi:hypothetical protein